MGPAVMVVLFILTALMMVAMVLVMFAVLRQGKRIQRLAHESMDLVRRADEHHSGQIDYDDLNEEEQQKLLQEMHKLAEAAGAQTPPLSEEERQAGSAESEPDGDETNSQD